MMTKYYRCTLLGDVVLNASLATEGNMDTLDYIPGSAFMGVVVNHLFKRNKSSDALQIIKNGKVFFGDATIEVEHACSYPTPFAYYMDKLQAKVGEHPIYLHHLIDKENPIKDKSGNRIQLKQQRSGYLTMDGDYLSHIQQNFSLKSAYNAEQRRADEGKMFGFTAINAGQTFRFSITADEAHLKMVDDIITGKHYIGKSRSAQYGAVMIEETEDSQKLCTFSPNGYTLVYAASNLCFYDETGRPTLQPTAAHLGLDSGQIDWARSQVRTHSYSPFNAKRNTTGTARYVISRGSVFYVTGATTDQKDARVGVHRNEGLGAVLYNPVFLEPSEDKPKVAMQLRQSRSAVLPKVESSFRSDHQSQRPLASLAIRRGRLDHDARAQAEEVNKIVKEWKSSTAFKNITPSQWGQIRSHAMNATSVDDLKLRLFAKSSDDDKKDRGYLAHGKVYDRHWKDKPCLDMLIKKIEELNANHAKPDIVAKIAAEMAKKPKEQGKKQNEA